MLIWYVNYGLTNQPVVEFTFGSPDQIRHTFQLTALTKNTPGTIDIINVFVRNRGRTDIVVIIAVQAINALVSATYNGPYNELANRALMVPAFSEYRLVTFYVTLKSQAPFFSLACKGSKLIDFTTFTTSVASTFGSVEPVSTNFLRYSQGSSNMYEYQLVQP